ncbi:MAG: SPOR domain-containing protein [Fimbriimonas sp.]
MDRVVSVPIPTLQSAEEIVAQLRQKGVPAHSIAVEDRTPAHGLSLGAGVTPDAVNAVIEEHDTEAAPGGYVVTVDTGGDVLNESAAREVFGYVA